MAKRIGIKESEKFITVNVFKNSENERRNLFLQTMVKTIAASEKNLKIVKLDT